ncbi:unnamed protein product [Heligmosomoides polygyrus]|uniref:EB domain-containing protein n=1 Tax=Heligmosomoides polygyrus TaxID=6339 RepID=A0A183FLR6_HELPZ|nr:unnamed protein product [Heligmosomoides polygyrus]
MQGIASQFGKPKERIGGRCTYSQQCGGGSSCLSNVCQCPSNTFNYGDGYCRSGGSGGTSPSGQCSNPSETVAYQNGAAINCLFSHCPTNSHCEYSNSVQQYVCCG